MFGPTLGATRSPSRASATRSATGGKSKFHPDTAAGPVGGTREDGAMGLAGGFRIDRPSYRLGEPIDLTLALRNAGTDDLYVFVPHGRADGVEITVEAGPAH